MFEGVGLGLEVFVLFPPTHLTFPPRGFTAGSFRGGASFPPLNRLGKGRGRLFLSTSSLITLLVSPDDLTTTLFLVELRALD